MLTEKDIINFFISSANNSNKELLGLEYELLCTEANTNKRLDFFSKPGIQELLFFLQEETNSEKIFEDNKLIRLKNANYAVTIEPGGQLEASFKPVENIYELASLLNSYLKLLKKAEKKLKINFFAVGVDPLNPISQVPWMPKYRYELMKNYFQHKCAYSHYMMKQTAAVQLNIDYLSEKDAIEKFHKAIHLYNNLALLTSNSQIYEGKLRKNPHFRREIWEQTDSQRCGIPVFNNTLINSFDAYIKFALNVPMLFIERNNTYVPFEGKISFNEFLNKGYKSYTAEMKDWILHLNTIFTVVRFNNNTIEIRLFDSNKSNIVLAISAIIKGLIYSDAIFSQETPMNKLLSIAEKNLSRKEQKYLKPLKYYLRKNTYPGNELAKKWNVKKIKKLLDPI